MATLLLIATGWSVHRIQQGVGHSFHRQRSGARADAVAAAASSPLYGQYGDYAAIMLAGDRAPLEVVRAADPQCARRAAARSLGTSTATPGEHERAAWVIARAREFPPDAAFAGLAAGDRATQSCVSATQRLRVSADNAVSRRQLAGGTTDRALHGQV